MSERLRLLDLRPRISYKMYCSSTGNGLLRVSMLDGNNLDGAPFGPHSEANGASLVTVFQFDRWWVEPDVINLSSPVHGPSHFDLHVAK